ncbi:MAG: Lrp/AsnC family transcriptional regulator [Kiloniellales bacterium]
MHDMINLDQFDLALLAALQQDGRLTNQELAGRVNLSASQCSRRRLRLEAAGIIAGYRATIDASAVGLGIAAFVQVTLVAHSNANAERFKALVRERPEILEAYTLTGDADYLLRVVTADLAALARFISDVLLPHGTVARVESRIVLDRLKENGALPFGQVA